jgi:hypothetical protein
LNQNLADIENTLQNTINIFNRRYSKLWLRICFMRIL